MLQEYKIIECCEKSLKKETHFVEAYTELQTHLKNENYPLGSEPSILYILIQVCFWSVSKKEKFTLI